MKIERIRIYFLSDVFSLPSSSWYLKGPWCGNENVKGRSKGLKGCIRENWQRQQYTGSKLYVAESCLTASLLGSFLTQVCLNPAYQQFEAEYILKKVSQTIVTAGVRYVLHFLVFFSFLLLSQPRSQ